MSRPASVTAAVVVLCLFASAAVYWLLVSYSRLAIPQLAVYSVVLLLLLAPVYGLVTRKAWSRFYSIVMFVLLAVLVLFGNGTMYFKQGVAVALFYGAVIAGLLLWLVISLMHRDVKSYFARQQ